MYYKAKVLRNRVWMFFTKERSIRFCALSFLITLSYGAWLTVSTTRDHDFIAVVMIIYLIPVSVAIGEVVSPSLGTSPLSVRAVSFFLIVVWIISIALYGLLYRIQLSSALPDCLILLFMTDILAIAAACVRPPIEQDAKLLKENNSTWFLYVLCLEREIAWPLTCAFLVLSNFALGVEGLLRMIIIVLTLLFFASAYIKMRKTVYTLRGN